jgi:hypothetical protein
VSLAYGWRLDPNPNASIGVGCQSALKGRGWRVFGGLESQDSKCLGYGVANNVKRGRQRWRLTISLAKAKPDIWRSIEVSPDTSLHEISLIVQIAFGWTYPDNYNFCINGVSYRGSNLYNGTKNRKPDPILISSLLELPGEHFTYERLGEAVWQFNVELSAVLRGDDTHPICLDGEGYMPSDEDFTGNEAFRDYLSGLKDQSVFIRDFYTEWTPGYNSFDMTQINETLRDLSEYES